MKKYDAIIVGASFAGLAVASRLKGNVLLIDRKEIGTNVTSACGTTVNLMKEVKCEKSILQIFNKAALHTKDNKIIIPLPEKYCTIDYFKFCKLLNKQNSAKFIKATAQGVQGKKVITDKGNFEADIIVDCTGWQAVLASSLKKDYVNKKMMSFGIETEIPYKKDSKLRFFIDSDIIENGAAWLFPCGKRARFGVGSYEGKTNVLPNLKKFVGNYKLKIGKVHGGYFCYCFKKPFIKNIFVAGCSAGQTLPLTGEGIKRSVHSGLKCGEIIQKILNNKISIKDAQKEYEEFAMKHKKSYQLLLNFQNKLPKLANWKLDIIARLLDIKPISSILIKEYEKI